MELTLPIDRPRRLALDYDKIKYFYSLDFIAQFADIYPLMAT